MKFYTLQNIIGIQVDEATGKAEILIRDKDAVVRIDLQNKQFKAMTKQEREQTVNGDIKNF